MPFGEVCLGRNHSEDGAKLNMRWMRGVFVGKLDRTDEFWLLTPIIEFVCWQSVECDRKEYATRTHDPTKG